jgi:hypothetical protein
MVRRRFVTLVVAALVTVSPLAVIGLAQSAPAGAAGLKSTAKVTGRTSLATAGVKVRANKEKVKVKTKAKITIGTTPTGPSTPVCTFNGSSLPLISGASAGEKINISCTGLAPLHPYLIMETSLLLGIDPKAAPLLTGKIVSVAGLMALFAALPEINPNALTFPISNLMGDLQESYVLPKSQASDPNATCPPTSMEINEGLIGCALATIDLTSFTPVAAGSAVVQYQGDPAFPAGPTVVLSTGTASVGQTVNVGDAPGATTFWWLSTLTALEALLGGGSAPTPTITVTVTGKKGAVTAPNAVTVSPASYDNPVLTPPKLAGSFTVPKGGRGKESVSVTYTSDLLGFNLSNSASAPLKVTK